MFISVIARNTHNSRGKNIYSVLINIVIIYSSIKVRIRLIFMGNTECQMVKVQFRIDILSVLISVQTVCNVNHRQLAASKETVNMYHQIYN